MRKAIQMAATIETDKAYPCVYALCNDGNIFQAVQRNSEWLPWEALPPIPQPKQSEADIIRCAYCNKEIIGFVKEYRGDPYHFGCEVKPTNGERDE